MSEDKKIIVRKRKKRPVKYNAAKHGMGNVLPEAEVVTFTGDAKTRARKKKLYEAGKKVRNFGDKIRGIISRREARGK